MPRSDDHGASLAAPGDSITRVAEIMKKEDVGSVPVVESASRGLVGIVTDRDIVVKVVAAGGAAEQATGRGTP